jgi:hypothetical protein
MGHIINPIRLRLGYSIFWQNNWPIYEKKRYIYFFGLYKELDQYFSTLFYTLKTPIYYDYLQEPFYGNISFPHLIYSNLQLNLLGFNSETLIVDVNIFDFFLQEYLTEFFSPLNQDKKIISFIRNLRSFFKLNYFLKYSQIIKKITKKSFKAIIKKRRIRFIFIQKIFINKITKFLEIYSETIKRSLFSYINDVNIIKDKELLYEDELFYLASMPFKLRKPLLEEYWKIKYQHITNNSLLTFIDYFTSVFYTEITSRNEQRLALIEDNRAKKFISKIQPIIEKGEKGYLKELLNEEFNLSMLQEDNSIQDYQNLLLNCFNERLTEFYLKRKKEKEQYNNNINIENPTLNHKYYFLQKINNTSNLNNDYRDEIKQSVLNLKTLYKKNEFFYSNIHSKNEKKNNYFLTIYKKIFNSSQKNLDLSVLFSNNDNDTTLDFIDKKIKNLKSLFPIQKDKLKDVKNKINNYIQQEIKNNPEKWFNYDIDPFYQKFILLKKFKNLILNININMGNSRLHISASFLTSYIKRLFSKNHPLWYVQRAIRRTLYKIKYLNGYLIIFSGRFTRAQYATYKLQTKGFLSFGNISKLIDFNTIGFTSIFGYCGIKVFLQYKNEWKILKKKTLTKINTYNDFINTNIFQDQKLNIISNPLNKNTKKIKRIINSYITTPKIPYYDKN